MRSTIVQFGDIQGLADRAVRPIGDTAQRRAILGGEAANQVITDGIGLAEHRTLSYVSTSSKSGFPEKNHRVEDGHSQEREETL